MSTCQGAPAPHRNCPHGELCDWTPPHVMEFEQDLLASLYDAVTPCCTCGWRGECCNNRSEALDAWTSHYERSSQ